MFDLGLDQIIQEMLMKLKKDLEVDEKITSEAKKAFFTFHEKHKDSGTATLRLHRNSGLMLFNLTNNHSYFIKILLKFTCFFKFCNI